MKIMVSIPCWKGNHKDCECSKYANSDSKDVGIPPFHDGCTCYCVADNPEEKQEDINDHNR